MTGEALAAAAEALVGTPFRLHGRTPATGLDCVGVVSAALASCGREVHEPAHYGIRNRSVAPLLALAEMNDLLASNAPVARGDVLLVRPGPGQHHLLVAVGPARFVHAHAGLRRVVVQPGPLAWPVGRIWRLSSEET